MKNLQGASLILRRLSFAGCGCYSRSSQPDSPTEPARPTRQTYDDLLADQNPHAKNLEAFLGAETDSQHEYIRKCVGRRHGEPMPTPPALALEDEALQMSKETCGEDCTICHPGWITQRTASTQPTRSKGQMVLRKKSFRRAELGKHAFGPTMAIDGHYLPFLRERIEKSTRPPTSYRWHKQLELRRDHILDGCHHIVRTQYPEPCGLNCACVTDGEPVVQHARVCTVCISAAIEGRYETTQQHAEQRINEAMNRTSLLDALLDPDQAKHAASYYDLEDFRGRRNAELKLYELAEPDLRRWNTIRTAETAYDARQKMLHTARLDDPDKTARLRHGTTVTSADKRRSDYRGVARTQDMATIKQHVEGGLERAKSHKAAKDRLRE
ncbi:MAG: hypothetical protein M1828_002384 [Chrysothrix sp. TS-e1954]|nr:MAG: hypothetical protein M1828_002384 [Chrysothrix sp. TS-e1954]